MIFTLSFRRITSDFAGVVCQLSRMASSFIRPESSRLNRSREARPNPGFVRYAACLNCWIPACAGMTER
jgi:hypothetical protein